MNLDKSVRNNDGENFLNQGSVTVEVHTQLINALGNIESRKSIRNHTFIHTTLIIRVTNITVGKPNM